ncbi:MAG TPA: type I-MYXAN CRISPR-associated Cas8a1/Cmx1 [Planctomycetota bacterium]|nr:type I-MYXAN CRISPR-associated Cas8a1/Cmx1 [Planctomycetota bacterium]
MAKELTRRKKETTAAATPPLVIGLSDPGMTPLLRAGLGGLAAALRAILLERDPKAKWPSPVELGPGRVTVEPTRVTLDWGGEPPVATLRVLFERGFRIDRHGLIDLAGTYEPNRPPDLAVAVALQGGLKRTFLQHGKTTTKSGAPRAVTVEIDEVPATTQVQPYSAYAHQGASEDVLAAMKSGSVKLAGWAYPGGAQRHVDFPETKCSFSASQVIVACFALSGCLSFEVARGGGGALVVVEPTDLVRFAALRPRLAPRRLAEAHVTGPGDALLAVHLAMRMDGTAGGRPEIGASHGILLRATPWVKKQKYRTALVDAESVPPERVQAYADLVSALPTTIRPTTDKLRSAEDEADEKASFFVATSALRAFVAENLASGRPWYQGFTGATTGGKKPRFIHYFRARDGKGLGALYLDERKGLVAMLKHVEEAEGALIRSVHTALRQRFGAIADECKGLPLATLKNRFAGERDRWRLAFAGSKTPAQIRAALADLWSRAGANKELRESWNLVLPLLRAEHWQAARDLALVALASYSGREEDTGDAVSEADATSDEEN